MKSALFLTFVLGLAPPLIADQESYEVVTDETTLGELALPPIRLGSSSTHARPFADLAIVYTQETNPGAEKRRKRRWGGGPARVAEGLALDVDIGADGHHYGSSTELVGVGFSVGGRNAAWDGYFFEPVARAESQAALRLGGLPVITLQAEEELTLGKIVEKQLFDKKKRFKLGPVRVNVRSRAYAALGTELGGTVLFSEAGGKPGSDLGIGLSLKAQAGASVFGSVSSGSRGWRVGGTARFTLIDALDQFAITARESGVDAQLRLRLEAVSAHLRVWIKIWFFKASRTLVNWRLAGFEEVFELL